MIRLSGVTALLLVVLTVVLIILCQLFIPELIANNYAVYHLPGKDTGWSFYVQDVSRGLRVEISSWPCFADFMPEAFTGSIWRILFVGAENDQLFVEDSLWGMRCYFHFLDGKEGDADNKS